MSIKFDGTIDELKEKVDQAGIQGRWQTGNGDEKCVFRSNNSGVLNWWPRTGTLQFQGSAKGKPELEALFESRLSAISPSELPNTSTDNQRQIFIVHGHDVQARNDLELALRRLNLSPFILMNTSSDGKTIIEALEGQIGRDFASDFGIVLMTPDDCGYSKEDGPGRAAPRARQNVILEAGMLLSSLTRSRIAFIVKSNLEIPSDLHGVIYIAYNDHINEAIPKLCEQLMQANFDIDPKLMSAATR